MPIQDNANDKLTSFASTITGSIKVRSVNLSTNGCTNCVYCFSPALLSIAAFLRNAPSIRLLSLVYF
jgi:hypothetical protein